MPQYAFDEYGQRFIVDEETGDMIPTPATSAEDAQKIAMIAQLKKYGRGAQALFSNPEERAVLQQEQLAEDELLKGVSTERPYSTMFGSGLPALPLGGIGAETSAIGSALLQGGLGAVEGMFDFDPNNPDQSARMGFGALFGAGGDMAGRVAGRIYNFGKGLFDEVQLSRAAEKFRELGGQLTPGQAADNPSLRQIDASFQKNPNTSGPFLEIGAANQSRTNELVGDAIGVPGAQAIDGAVLRESSEKIGRVFENVKNTAGSIDIDPTTTKRLIALDPSKWRKLKAQGGAQGVPQELLTSKGLPEGANPDNYFATFTGDEIIELRATIGEAMQKAVADGDETLLPYYAQLLDGVDDQLSEQIGPELAAEFAQAREWARVKRLVEFDPTVRKPGGDISPATLYNRMTKERGFGRAFTRDMGQRGTQGPGGVNNPETASLMDWVDASANRQVQPIIGDSGTVGGAFVPRLVNDILNTGGAGVVAETILARGYTAAGDRIGGGLGRASQQGPLIFPRAGGTVGITQNDALTELIFGQDE